MNHLSRYLKIKKIIDTRLYKLYCKHFTIHLKNGSEVGTREKGVGKATCCMSGESFRRGIKSPSIKNVSYHSPYTCITCEIGILVEKRPS